MIHLLVVNVHFFPRSYGGATIVAEELVRALQRTGRYRISVVSFTNHGLGTTDSLLRSQIFGDVTHFQINIARARDWFESISSDTVSQRFGALLEQLSPDVAHVHCIQELGVGILTELGDRDVPFILSIHDYWWICERQFMFDATGKCCDQTVIDHDICRNCATHPQLLDRRRSLCATAMFEADLLTYPSEHTRRQYERNGAPADRGIVVKNGVVLPQGDYLEKRARYEPQPKTSLRFGYVGGPAALKGWPMIQAAFRALDVEDWTLRLVDAGKAVGRPWWQDKDLEGYRGQVEIVPPYKMDTIDDFYASIDVLLFASQWNETFGLTVREALARGIYVVSTDCGGPSEDLVHGVNGHVLSGFGTDEELRKTLQELIENGVPKSNALTASRVISFDEQAAQVDNLIRGHLIPIKHEAYG